MLYEVSIEPHVIAQCTAAGACRVVAATTSAEFMRVMLHKFHIQAVELGSNAVRISKQFYLSALSGVTTTDGSPATERDNPSRTYLTFWYLFSTALPHAIVKVSAEPVDLAVNATNAAVSSLAYVDGRLVAGITVPGARGVVKTIDVPAAIKHMRNVV